MPCETDKNTFYSDTNTKKLLGIGHQLLLYRNRIFEPYGVTGKQAMILTYILFHGDSHLSQRDIEKEFRLRPSTINSALCYLEDGGFIERTVSESDARAKRVTATEKGEKIFKDLCECTAGQEKAMINGFSEDEIKQLNNYLDRIFANITQSQKVSHD